MTIEFDCPRCGRLLRTSDDKSGRSASCPGCGSAVTVPSADRSNQPAIEGISNEPAPTPSRDRPRLRTGADSKLCPACSEEINAAATCCPYCGEVVGRAHVRTEYGGHLKPHRASLLLTMSVLSWVACFVCACCIVFGLAGIATAIVTIVLANQDLKEMRDGMMDPSGEGMTTAARVVAIVLLCLGALAIAIYVTIYLVAIFGNNLQGAFGF